MHHARATLQHLCYDGALRAGYIKWRRGRGAQAVAFARQTAITVTRTYRLLQVVYSVVRFVFHVF